MGLLASFHIDSWVFSSQAFKETQIDDAYTKLKYDIVELHPNGFTLIGFLLMLNLLLLYGFKDLRIKLKNSVSYAI